MEGLNNFINYLRKERHDFMNDIQVIYGYIQLERNKEAKQYIQKIVEKNSCISRVYALGNEYFGFLIEENLKKFLNKGIKVELHIEIDGFLKTTFQKDYNKKRILVNNIFNEVENYKSDFVYIYIFEDELGESLFIANKESLVDELDWIEEWEQIYSEETYIKIHKYNYDKNFAYRLTFT
ncbi:Spo0B domain-containing protein [Clostridium sp. ZS2-4]|uniref:Spo0B domain-containing protein n=1 Tax=Clostridium sp. ZS2-4 TaxID=2987703 RepID=UPI00227CF341|nr:Spo0B domain-containing protein [Clostridium sp. ZS2-4]MCY6355749.1 Spo0B domain-containing protein [Clostridium sp. ZS2-4]